MAKQKILDLLKSPDFEKGLEGLKNIPVYRVLQDLLPALGDEDEEIKWHAVTAAGILVADFAEREPEGARNILRRMMWSLNEESGSIGWGVPEAMGEILARSEQLVRDFAPLLVSYIRPDGNLLDFEPLQRGTLWGIGRLAEVHPQLLESLNAGRYLLLFLDSADPWVRGYAALALGRLGEKRSVPLLESLLQDETEIKIYQDQKFRTLRVSQLAREALERIERLLK